MEKYKNPINNNFEKIKKGWVDKNNKNIHKQYNDEIVRKTWEYQKRYGFETNPRQGHEFWNVEADAFKHAFMSADLYFKYGDIGSTYAGIQHESQTPNNPQGEWNMDSWNNNQGREIAKEIQKEYGRRFENLSQKQKDDIIAAKVITRMNEGKLITHPDDERVYKGVPENVINQYRKWREAHTTKQTANPEQKPHIYTREEIGKMTTDEFAQHEKAIMKQMKEKGIPTKKELENSRNKSTSKTPNTSDSDGRWVTINGKHILIEK